MIILGASGHGKVILECCRVLGIEVTAFADKDPTKHGVFMGLPVIPEDQVDNGQCLIGVGDNVTRKKIAEKLGLIDNQNLQPSTLNPQLSEPILHPSASISPQAHIGPGTVIFHRAIIQTGSVIGQHCIINTAASVDHDCKIGDFVHIAPGVTLCGGVHVGEGTLIGAGAVVIPGISIGKWVTVGAGSVVVEDIPNFAVAVGNPAKVIKFNPE